MLSFLAALISCKTLQSTETNPHIRQGILLPVRWVIVGAYGLRLEAEYAFRRNAIRKIHFFAEGSSKHGHFQTSSYMANLLWDLPYLPGDVHFGISNLLLELA